MAVHILSEFSTQNDTNQPGELRDETGVHTSRGAWVCSMWLVFSVLSMFRCAEDEPEDVMISQDITFSVPINLTSITEGQTGTAIHDTQWPVEFSPTFDLIAMNPEIARYQGQIKEVRITSLAYSASSNTLTQDLPSAGLYTAPFGVTSISDSRVAPLAQTDVIEAGVDFSKREAAIDSVGQQQASQHISMLRFSVLFGLTLAVAQGEEIPEGQVNITVTISVTLIASPL